MSVVNNMDLFANIPREITIDILSRLPIGSIIKAKFVRKEFCDVIESPDFHPSEPHPPLLVISNTFPSSSTSWHAKLLKLKKDDRIPPNTVAIDLSVPGYTPLLLSPVNGLILLLENHDDLTRHHLSICNPITREYVTLPNPPPPEYHYSRNSSFGLGVTRRTRRYKVVRIVQLHSKEYECQVYTLGTGKWRAIIAGTPPMKSKAVCSFVGGNLHWLVWSEDKEEEEVSRFDLEKEDFTSLSAPPRCHDLTSHRNLYVFNDCLCLCDDSWSTSNGQIVIWLMRDGKSWTKDFFIYKTCYYRRKFGFLRLTPFKVLENGDLIMWDRTIACTFCYPSKTKYILDYTNFLDPSFDFQSTASLNPN